jgi:hypothetical protein
MLSAASVRMNPMANERIQGKSNKNLIGKGETEEKSNNSAEIQKADPKPSYSPPPMSVDSQPDDGS